MVIQKVWKNKSNQQKLVTIPKDSEINEGDLVEIKKIKTRTIARVFTPIKSKVKVPIYKETIIPVYKENEK